MEDERGRGARARGGDRADGGAQLVRMIAEERDHWGHQDPAAQAVLGEGAHDVQTALAGDRAP
ncbi:hypothetical protein AB0451_19115 [Streptomyces sp. NPDC052000]|uniref:hypothetical protein n=1 Tax=Streptomyces sp. NPDC052000 TaxID=3155676 RepID=UPI00344B09DE